MDKYLTIENNSPIFQACLRLIIKIFLNLTFFQHYFSTASSLIFEGGQMDPISSQISSLRVSNRMVNLDTVQSWGFQRRNTNDSTHRPEKQHPIWCSESGPKETSRTRCRHRHFTPICWYFIQRPEGKVDSVSLTRTSFTSDSQTVPQSLLPSCILSRPFFATYKLHRILFVKVVSRRSIVVIAGFNEHQKAFDDRTPSLITLSIQVIISMVHP